jgi:hypothetical protein
MLLKKVKNAIVFFAATVVVSGAVVCNVSAATNIDKNADINITAQIGEDDSSVFSKTYNGTVNIDLYKIADLDEAGNPQLLSRYAGSDIDLSVLSDKSVVADVEKKIVGPAIKAVKGQAADYRITASRNNGSFSGAISIKAGAGIYLYIPRATSDDKYNYTFIPYIIYAPSSEYIASGKTGGDDTWKYDVSFILKPSETPIEVTIPDDPTPKHPEEIIEFDEDVIEMGSQVPLFGGRPKTGDSLLPIIICGLALVIGMGMIIWYFNNRNINRQKAK